MNKKVLFTALTFLSISALAFGQNSRVSSLGGMTYAIPDRDYSLDLFDFGKNPAWLINDEKVTFLQIMPSYNSTWGDYRRKYDFDNSDIYGVAFRGVKTLGSSGTFLGYTNYNYEQRNNVYRTLKHDTYAGEAFYMTDTTTGNFRYNGPTVGFNYSFELAHDLFAGVSAEYGVMDGLKNIYSGAKATVRNVNGKVGLAYKFSDDFILGSSVFMHDNQEALEMASIDGTDVEIFNYRGETYATSLKNTTLDQKVRKKGSGFDGQVYLSPAKNLEVAFKGLYDQSGTYEYIPYTGVKEFEEGYADFENYCFDFQARYKGIENLQLSLIANYSHNYSWSRNSVRNLLLWEWKLDGPTVGLGGSYYFRSIGLLVGAEVELSSIKADSSKYIDLRFEKITSNNSQLRAGLEYEIMNETFVRAGYNYGNQQYDFIYGGKDVKINYLSLGCGYKISDMIGLDLSLQYGNLSPKNYGDRKRDNLNVMANLRVLSF
ncbi:MAG: hypothetical protein Q8933_18770 [Bacteroidota bacterium]|nr:hypothetical protein [Bacteroidota bacterium]